MATQDVFTFQDSFSHHQSCLILTTAFIFILRPQESWKNDIYLEVVENFQLLWHFVGLFLCKTRFTLGLYKELGRGATQSNLIAMNKSSYFLCLLQMLIRTIRIRKKLLGFRNIHEMLEKNVYSKVKSSTTSHFEAPSGLFRVSMKEILDAYVLWPFSKGFI